LSLFLSVHYGKFSSITMSHHHHHRRNKHHDEATLQGLNSQIATLLSTKLDTSEEGVEYPKNAKEAWRFLKKGNARFAEGNLSEYIIHLAHEVNPHRRQELGTGQHPFAVILTCSDSRVSPELIFDQGLGDVFVTRTAGNVPDSVALGSLEYGLLHLKAPLLVVLGHTKCGAVTATLDVIAAGNQAHGGGEKTHIGSIVDQVRPAAEAAFQKHGNTPEALKLAVEQNVRTVAENLLSLSSSINKLVEEDKIDIVRAVYDIDTGVIFEV